MDDCDDKHLCMCIVGHQTQTRCPRFVGGPLPGLLSSDQFEASEKTRLRLEFLEDSVGDLLSGGFTSDIRCQVFPFLENGIDSGVDPDCRFDVSE